MRRHEHIIPGFSFIHDFAITPNYCIFFQNPVTYNPFPFLFGFRGAGECVKFQPDRPTRILVIPRNSPYQGIKILETESGFVFHHANAFELEDKIQIDSVCYESLPEIEANMSYKEVDFDTLAPGKLWRFTLNLDDETVHKQLIESRCCEFPSTHPDKVGNPYRYLFLSAAHNPNGNAPQQAILKLDWKTQERQLWSFAPNGYVSEPIFVPQPNASSECEGWIMTVVYDGSRHRSDVVILDGRDLTKGPIAQLHLKQHIPYGLHGSWTSQCFAEKH